MDSGNTYHRREHQQSEYPLAKIVMIDTQERLKSNGKIPIKILDPGYRLHVNYCSTTTEKGKVPFKYIYESPVIQQSMSWVHQY